MSFKIVRGTIGSFAILIATRNASSRDSCFIDLCRCELIFKIDVRERLPMRVLYGETFRLLLDRPGRWEATFSHPISHQPASDKNSAALVPATIANAKGMIRLSPSPLDMLGTIAKRHCGRQGTRSRDRTVVAAADRTVLSLEYHPRPAYRLAEVPRALGGLGHGWPLAVARHWDASSMWRRVRR